MKHIAWLILTVAALGGGIAIGYAIASREASSDRVDLQQTVLMASFGNAVEAALAGDPAASAQAQRDYLAVSDVIDGWPAPWVISTQRIGALTRLGLALDELGQSESADRAFADALALAQSLANSPDPGLRNVWQDLLSEQALTDWIREADSQE